MTSNLKVIVSAAGVAALLASPALAKTEHHRTVPALVNVPADAHASAASASTNGSLVTVYAPDVKVQAHPSSTVNPDFQLSSEK
jgi:hypothetical protein